MLSRQPILHTVSPSNRGRRTLRELVGRSKKGNGVCAILSIRLGDKEIVGARKSTAQLESILLVLESESPVGDYFVES